MIAIPQCLDFADARLTKDICEFYLRMLEIKNREIYLHSQQVANYSASTAAKLGLPASEVSQIKTAALLHDIGQLSVPNIILAKLPFLSTREQSIYKRHCIAGASMLENIPGFDTISDIIRAHHEKWDGICYSAILAHTIKIALSVLPRPTMLFSFSGHPCSCEPGCFIFYKFVNALLIRCSSLRHHPIVQCRLPSAIPAPG